MEFASSTCEKRNRGTDGTGAMQGSGPGEQWGPTTALAANPLLPHTTITSPLGILTEPIIFNGFASDNVILSDKLLPHVTEFCF